MRCSRSRLLLILLCLTATPCAVGATVHDLDDLEGDLPYEPSYAADFQTFYGAATAWPKTISCDLDRDGWDEALLALPEVILCLDFEGELPTLRWRWTLPPRYSDPQSPPSLGPCSDLNGDGWPEILLTARSRDGQEHVFWAFDPQTSRQVFELPLPSPAAPAGSAAWDGHYRICGVLPPQELGRRLPAVLFAAAGSPIAAPGLLAVDPGSGEQVWSFGTKPIAAPNQVWVGDVDRDGSTEIVLAHHGPDKPADGGAADHSSASEILVLTARGEVRWRQQLSSVAGRVYLRVADLDADGDIEIVTATGTLATGLNDRLCIWEGATGRMRAQKVAAAPYCGLLIMPDTARKGGHLFAGSTGGTLHRYWFDGERLTSTDRAITHGGVKALAIGDLVTEKGSEILVATTAGNLVVLSERLEPLAAIPLESHSIHQIRALVWEAGPKSRFVLADAGPIIVFSLRGDSAAEVTAWLYLLVVLPLLGAGFFLWTRCRQQAPTVVHASLRSDRELLARLLQQLEQSSHGAISATKGLRRLVWQLEALCSEMGRSDELIHRTRQTLADFKEAVYPRLLSIFQLAGAAQFEMALAKVTESELRRIVAMIDRLAGAGLPEREILQDLADIRQGRDRTETGLQRLRAAVEAYFTADIHKMLTRVLHIREEEFARTGITVRHQSPELKDGVLCRIDPSDLRFVLDTLTDNAIMAMVASPRRQLTASLRLLDGSVCLEVKDTGKGILPQEQSRLFTYRYSSWDGNGLGLYRSRQILQKWGGDLELKHSGPGEGSIFVLSLARARSGRDLQENVAKA